jgi:hypothetical protein
MLPIFPRYNLSAGGQIPSRPEGVEKWRWRSWERFLGVERSGPNERKRRIEMKKKTAFLALQVVCVAILLGISIHCVTGDNEQGGKEKKVSIEQVPAQVKAAILKAVGKGKLVDIGEITTPGRGARTARFTSLPGSSPFSARSWSVRTAS